MTLAPGAELSVPWSPAFSALAYVLTGRGSVGPERRPIESGQLVVFGRGDHLVVAAADSQAERLDVLLLGGLPIGAPIVHYGPFVMNTRAEIIQAVEDYQAGRLGAIPADQLEAPELRMSRPATSRPGTNPEATAAVTELFDAAGPFPIDLGGSVAGGRMLPRPERDR